MNSYTESDRPAREVQEIEVTPEMIEAGLSAYLEACPDTGAGDRIDREMVDRIFRSMMFVKLGLIGSQ